ncbi:MAG: hypothetical protein IKK66_03980 [Ruminococcus sp.]|nr:hypothetical protein [Ruminococcus sp.]
MFGLIKKKKQEVRDRTIYMEVFGDNKVSYRVTSGKITCEDAEIITYGVEVENSRTGQREVIPDFSRNIEDAVDFAEMLIVGRTPPFRLYNHALNYLMISI